MKIKDILQGEDIKFREFRDAMAMVKRQQNQKLSKKLQHLKWKEEEKRNTM